MDETFVGRVRLTSLQASKAAVQGTEGGYTMQPSVQVVFHAVKDGDEEDTMFGRYTPSGEIKLTIANPAVAALLESAWHDWLARDEPETQGYPQGYEGQPKYEVVFRRIK